MLGACFFFIGITGSQGFAGGIIEFKDISLKYRGSPLYSRYELMVMQSMPAEGYHRGITSEDS